MSGAADEARTRYLHLGKVALYQMSYARKWCPEPESNQRHGDFQSPALPTELQRRMATRKGLEPSTSGVTGRRSNQLNYRAIFLSKDSGRCNLSWQGQKDSNPRHAVLETAALPTELCPYVKSPQYLTCCGLCYGAVRQIRTADLILTKDALYRLSYNSMWRPGSGSN